MKNKIVEGSNSFDELIKCLGENKVIKISIKSDYFGLVNIQKVSSVKISQNKLFIDCPGYTALLIERKNISFILCSEKELCIDIYLKNEDVIKLVLY